MAEFTTTATDKFRVDRVDRRSGLLQSDLEGWGLSGVTLRPYQLEGVSWLAGCLEGGHGCILGDEMGLGKTVQVVIIAMSEIQDKPHPHNFYAVDIPPVVPEWL